jgi:hypothetical protein
MPEVSRKEKEMKKKTLSVLLVIVLVFALSGSALILANFSAMKSNIVQNSSVASSTGGDESALNRSPDQTGLFVSNGKLGAALHQALTKQLSGQVFTGQIVPVDGTSDKADYPLLFVSVDQQNITWTPVYAKADLKVSIYYSTDGDVSFRHSQPPEFKMTTNQPTLKMDGTYSFSDVSWGLISNPGYINYLAGEIAKAISANIQNGK